MKYIDKNVDFCKFLCRQSESLVSGDSDSDIEKLAEYTGHNIYSRYSIYLSWKWSMQNVWLILAKCTVNFTVELENLSTLEIKVIWSRKIIHILII